MELGSEFNLSLSALDRTDNHVLSYIRNSGTPAVFLDSGRSAIRLCLRNLNTDGEILLPEFICESVINCFPSGNVRFYKITEQFSADTDDIRQKVSEKTSVVFLMHYFGALQPQSVLDTLLELKKEYGFTILEDATHSLFTKVRTIGDIVVASIRKWMQVPRGGVLISKDLPEIDLPKQRDNTKAYGMILKDLFLQEKLDCNTEYRKIFAETEEQLDEQEEIYTLSDLSEFIMNCVDIGAMIEKRRSNYAYLADGLLKLGIKPAVDLGEDGCPLVLPIRVPDRNSFRAYLMNEKIYCAVHWPRDGIREEERSQAVRNSDELISLPVDQRYSREDMDYLLSCISHYGGELLF